MKLKPLYLFVFLSLLYACKAQKPDVKHPEKNGTLILSMERTPCYGRCPIYQVRLYANGLFIYEAKKFTDTTGCFYRVLSKQQLTELKDKFDHSDFFSLANAYPDNAKAPTDLPSCILFYNNGTQQKTITDKRWQTPESLTALQKSIDSLIKPEILQFCDN